MRQLTTLTELAVAGEFCRVLGEAGVQAQITTESMGPWGTPARFVIWVDEGADAEVIRRAYGALRPAESPHANTAVTRVCAADEQVKCLACGYDLRGQISDGRCPECGHPYRVIGKRNCADCGAEMPEDFDVCWNCGSDIKAAG